MKSCGRYEDVLARLHDGNYTVPQTTAFDRCRAQLPWWRSIDSQ